MVHQLYRFFAHLYSSKLDYPRNIRLFTSHADCLGSDRVVVQCLTCEDQAVGKVSLACAYIILLIRPMAASNDDVAALPPATCAELANDSSPVPTTTFVSPSAGPLLPGVQTLAGFFCAV